MVRRHLQDTLARSLRQFPAALLIGARQVGKSTLAEALAREEWPARYVTLDQRTTLDAALLDPDGFVRELEPPVVIDEVQRAPDLLRALKLAIDRDRRPGRYLLTGSANLLGLDAIPETLAGRIAVHRLSPFSFSERLGQQRPPLIDLLFTSESAAKFLRDLPADGGAGVSMLKESIMAGGYPTPALMQDPADRATWYDSFRQTYIDRDLRELAQISNLPEFSRLMITLANRTSQLLNVAELSRDIGLPATTLRRYLNLLQLTFQLDLLPTFATNRSKRLVKTPKAYFTDTGMAAHLAAVSAWPDAERRQLVGPLFETWVHDELRKLVSLSAPQPELSYWRTRTNQEVDFLIERGEEVVGLEVKWSASIDPRQLKALNACREALGKRWRLGVLLHGGTEAVALDHQTVALPAARAFGGDLST